MVGSLVLDDQSLVALHTLEYGRLLDGPSTNVCPLLVVGLDVLLCVRGVPSGLPVVGELFEERCLELCGLDCVSATACQLAIPETYSKGRLCDRGRGRRGFGRAGIVCARNGGSERNGSANCKTHLACLLSRVEQRSWVRWRWRWRRRVHGLMGRARSYINMLVL